MAEESFLNLTCIIHSVETPQGVYWRHNNQLLSSQSGGLVTVSPLSRSSNTTFSISLSVWLTSTRQSGEQAGPVLRPDPTQLDCRQLSVCSHQHQASCCSRPCSRR